MLPWPGIKLVLQLPIIQFWRTQAGCVQEKYEQPRQQANVTMMGGLDLLKRFFSPQQGLVASMRNLGLDAVNATPMVKQQIMKYAMG